MRGISSPIYPPLVGSKKRLSLDDYFPVTAMNNSDEKTKELEEEIDRLRKETIELRHRLANAKDPSPIQRVSFIRVKRMAIACCLTLVKTAGKFILKLGSRVREFTRLRDIFDLLNQEEFNLEDIFPPKKEKSPFSKCKFCGEDILWKCLDRWIPLNPDHSRHRCRSA